ncbi:MAG: universal stress protein [Nitrospirae bacterium]|nr:MAG: universal stress protein [Nitrospirota bacterium]
MVMKILVPVDGSEYSDGAVGFLSGWNLTEEDEVVLLYVVDFVPMTTEIPAYIEISQVLLNEVAPRLLEEAEKIITSTKAKVTKEPKEGPVAQTIIDTAIDVNADLIVMGTRGRKGLEGLLLGSTARAVASKAPVPVLVVRKNLWGKKGPLKVLIATDGTEYSQNAIDTFKKLPLDEQSEITVMHVVQSAVHDIPERFFIEVDDRMKSLVEKVRTEEFNRASSVVDTAAEQISQKFQKVHTLLKTGDPSEEILQAAKVLEADLIVTGCRGRTGLKGMLGSVSRDILRHAESSVLICKRC